MDPDDFRTGHTKVRMTHPHKCTHAQAGYTQKVVHVFKSCATKALPSVGMDPDDFRTGHTKVRMKHPHKCMHAHARYM